MYHPEGLNILSLKAVSLGSFKQRESKQNTHSKDKAEGEELSVAWVQLKGHIL